MSYLVLARKYRPLDFKSVSGQEHVTRTLANAIKRDKIPHAILLTGPRGVGKTSIARIFSKAINCEKGPIADPCLKCVNCEEITQGRSLAVQEIDGASHNSVDNVRELIDTFRSLPAPGYKYKIYIIDEVHMLSTAAFNALLKSLEEPPAHTIFILATTEVHKIPDTVISRCQRHDLRALTISEVCDQLDKITRVEKIKIDSEAVRMIARLSEGSMRDAQSLLDRVQTFCEDQISAQEAAAILGMLEKRAYNLISEAIFRREPAKVLELSEQVFSAGLDISIFLKEFVQHWRELLIAKFGGEKALLQMGVGEEQAIELLRQVRAVDAADLQDLIAIAREGADIAIRSSHPTFAMEALLVRMASRERVRDIAKIINDLSGGKIGSGGRDKSDPGPITRKQSGENTQADLPKVVRRGEAFSWQNFVNFAVKNASRILVEHIKRLEVSSFTEGDLAVRGPEFTIRSLEKGSYHDKLIEVLRNFSGKKDWRIEFGVAQQNEVTNLTSVLQMEKQKQVQTMADKKRDITAHPHIQKLKSIFPGSAIEDIKIKD